MLVTNTVTTLFLCAMLIRKQSDLAVHIARKLHRIRQRLRAGNSVIRVRPRCGVPLSGIEKTYQTNRLTDRYEHLRSEETWFSWTVHMSSSEFDELHDFVASEINSPLDPHNRLTYDQRLAVRRKRKKLNSKELLLVYLELLSRGTTGTHGIVDMATRYGVSSASIWNNIYHTGWACCRALSIKEPITWPRSAERKSMKGLIRGFPEAVLFVDGTRQRIFKSGDEDLQNDQYFGKDKVHCFAVLVYVDVYGIIRRIEVSYSGRVHDKSMFQMSDVYLNRERYFSTNEKMICDAGFVGAGDKNWILVPFKKGTGLYFSLRNEWNKDIRQRFRNEMSIGYIKNRNRAFIGCWPFAEELFTASIKVAAMIMNWKLKTKRTSDSTD